MILDMQGGFLTVERGGVEIKVIPQKNYTQKWIVRFLVIRFYFKIKLSKIKNPLKIRISKWAWKNVLFPCELSVIPRGY